MAGRGQTSFEGRVEHIDSGHARRFRSLDEFLGFIEQMLADCSDPDRGDEDELVGTFGRNSSVGLEKQEQRAEGAS
jgi:hypothetical protein